MSAHRRGLSERVVWAWNPLPNVSHKDVLARAQLPLVAPTERCPFAMHWQYGFGSEREDIYLDPGAAHPLRESEAREILHSLRDQGLVLLEHEDDASERRRTIRAGLATAHGFWRDRGARRIHEIRARHGFNDDEMEAQRYDLLRPYHENQAKADILQDAILELDTQPDAPKQPEGSPSRA